MQIHYVYRIENLIDGKIYIGKHTTSQLEDGYMGSGKLLIKAIEKHGLENFKKTILGFFETEEEAFQYERSLVTEDFVKRKDTYNLTCGGSGSWYAANSNEELRKVKNKHAALLMNRTLWNDPEWKNNAIKRASNRFKKFWKEGKLKPLNWSGRVHKPETIEKMKKTHVERNHQQGEKNSQFGTCWIYNVEQKVSKKVKIEELQNYVENGWLKGRKMSW
jgi:hypothetical protein